MDHSRAPLFEEMVAYHRQIQGNFHIPGHKGGKAFDREAHSLFSPLLPLDVTEVANLDDLHHPHGVIQQAQELAADAFGAEHTLFLVGGTTAGILATLLYLCQRGETVIVQRTSHQSVFHGCLLAGANPVYLPVEIDRLTGLEKPVQLDQLDDLLQRFPSTRAVILTRPSYFGVTYELFSLVERCHGLGIPLVVDEAHGAHLGFSPLLPPSALQQGADVVVQSTHKMLTSMTMSSMLHIQANRVDKEGIAGWLRVLESSSPSYPLMASLDVTRRFMVKEGRERIGQVLDRLNHFRLRLEHLSSVQEIKSEDPFKCMLRVKGASGYTLQRYLEERGRYVEMADHHKVLLVFSMATTEEELDRLFVLLLDLDKKKLPLEKIPPIVPFPQGDGVLGGGNGEEAGKRFHEMRRRKSVNIPLESAVGRIASTMITPYPPGIPLVLPGEKITIASVEYVQRTLEMGGSVRGVDRSSALHVGVVE